MDNFTFFPLYLQHKQCKTFPNFFIYDATEIFGDYFLKYKVFQADLTQDQIMEELSNLPKEAVEGWTRKNEPTD